MTIQELAEKEYPMYSMQQQAFIKGAELSIGFAEWLRLNYHLGENNHFWHPNTGTGIRYNTEQLWTKYLHTLTTKH